MANYYCEFCGQKFSTIQSLAINKCLQYPGGSLKGNHKLYEGGEKLQYICKYCGQKASSLAKLVVNKCMRHPSGSFKGNHSPAL